MIEDARPVATLALPQLLQISRRSHQAQPTISFVCAHRYRNFSPLPLGSVLAEDDGMRWVVDEPGARILFPCPMLPKASVRR